MRRICCPERHPRKESAPILLRRSGRTCETESRISSMRGGNPIESRRRAAKRAHAARARRRANVRSPDSLLQSVCPVSPVDAAGVELVPVIRVFRRPLHMPRDRRECLPQALCAQGTPLDFLRWPNPAFPKRHQGRAGPHKLGRLRPLGRFWHRLLWELVWPQGPGTEWCG